MDAGKFVTKLLEKCLESVPHKYNAFKNIILNLSRCNYCNDVRGNIENLNTLYEQMFLILLKAVIVYFHSFTHISCVNRFLG